MENCQAAARYALLPVLAMLVSACASWPAPVLEKAGNELPHTFFIDDVPFYPQTEYQCGPAALATVLEYSGQAIDYDQLVASVYLPERRGSLQAELNAAGRSAGRIVYRLDPDPAAVLSEVAAGRPVLVLENHGLRVRPVWHYAVVIGYDLDAGTIVQHSGENAEWTVSARRWQRWWQRAGGWAIVTLAPDEMPESPELARWRQALADFEANADPGLAGTAWRNGASRWPDDPIMWLGVGNTSLALDQNDQARDAYRQVIALDSEYAPGRFNLAMVERRLGRHCAAADHFSRLLDHPQLGERAAREASQSLNDCDDQGDH